MQADRSESKEIGEIEAVVEADAVGPEYVEKPYVLVPAKKAEKGYVLLREILARTGRVGIARVVIRSREYLCEVVPRDKALYLMLLRYPQEIVDASEYSIPDQAPSHYRISAREMDMAEQLIEAMSTKWKADDYKDEYRDRLKKTIEKRMKSKGVVTPVEREEEPAEETATNVVDFMSLLQKSLSDNKRTPAAKKAPAKKAAARSKQKAPAKKAAKRAGHRRR